MKKLLFLSIIGLTFATQGIAVAQDSEGLNNEDFTDLTCGYIVDSEDIKESAYDAYAAIVSIITDEQIETLRQISEGTIAVSSFCANFDS